MTHETGLDQVVFARARARTGTTLGGKYRLDALLGVGGMAAVYRATHRNSAVFAIKVLHPEYALHKDVRARFLREGYIANSIKHEGVPRMIDDEAIDGGDAYTVMDLLEGVAVDQLAAHHGGRLPLRAVVAIGIGVLDVLAAAHAASVTHRDIKPANLFVRFDGRVVLLDFGIARVYDAASSGGVSTATGIVMGTPAFMAPEMAIGDKNTAGALTDVWSLGATLFTLAAGRTVHVADTGPQFIVFAATRDPTPIVEVRPDVGPSLAAVIDRSLAREPDKRWSSATAMREALIAAARSDFGDIPGPADLTSLFARDVVSLDHADTVTMAAYTTEPTSARGVDGFFRAIVQTVRGFGIDVDAALAATGMDLKAHEAGAPATSRNLVDFLEHAAKIGSEPSLGVKVATGLPLGASGGLDYATRTSRTFGEAIERTARLYGFVSDRARLVIEEEGDRLHVVIQPVAGGPRGPQITEFVIALILTRAREALRMAVPLLAVHFSHSRVPGSLDLAATFGVPVVYEHARDEIVLPRSVSYLRFETSDPLLADLLDRHTERLARR